MTECNSVHAEEGERDVPDYDKVALLMSLVSIPCTGLGLWLVNVWSRGADNPLTSQTQGMWQGSDKLIMGSPLLMCALMSIVPLGANVIVRVRAKRATGAKRPGKTPVVDPREASSDGNAAGGKSA